MGTDKLSPDDVERRRAEYRASWEAHQRDLQDPERMAWLRQQIKALDERVARRPLPD